jgi:hypothetical protein
VGIARPRQNTAGADDGIKHIPEPLERMLRIVVLNPSFANRVALVMGHGRPLVDASALETCRPVNPDAGNISSEFRTSV